MIHIKNNQCPICLNENLKWNLNIKKSDMHMFKCGHGTCKECYNTLISTSEFSCPCCRATSQAYTTGFNSSEINQWNTFAEWYQEYDIFIRSGAANNILKTTNFGKQLRRLIKENAAKK